MIAQLMLEGVRLMLLGMGIVFGFLVLLVFVMKAMSRLAIAIGGHADIAVSPPAVSSAPETLDKDVIAAVTAAVHRYRSEHVKYP